MTAYTSSRRITCSMPLPSCSFVCLRGCRSRSLPELVRRHLSRDSVDVPEAADHELADHEAEEERHGALKAAAAPVAQDNDLQDPRDEQREPDEVDLPAGGDGEGERMERPPGE